MKLKNELLWSKVESISVLKTFILSEKNQNRTLISMIYQISGSKFILNNNETITRREAWYTLEI